MQHNIYTAKHIYMKYLIFDDTNIMMVNYQKKYYTFDLGYLI